MKDEEKAMITSKNTLAQPMIPSKAKKPKVIMDDPHITNTQVMYQRLDGFKRYMALKELGYKWIIVQIVSTWVGGAQVNQPWVL